MSERKSKWWLYGLVGACGLSIATVHKAVIEIPASLLGKTDLPWRELPGFAVEIFLMGFVCGLVAWLLRFLPFYLGRLGDALMVVLVMNAFFLCCMILFARSLLTSNIGGGMIMFAMATVVGIVLGLWVGHDLREWIRENSGGPESGV